MPTFDFPAKKNISLLALGAESAGNFSVFRNGKIFLSEDFGDLLEDANWKKYQNSLFEYIRKNKLRPSIILSDLHPDFRTTALGKKLAEKFNAKPIQVQHHLAHTFSSIGDRLMNNPKNKLPDISYSIVMDGTGLGTDGNIWGGEIFRVKFPSPSPILEGGIKGGLSVQRIGHLENQIMLGGDLAIKEPARMLISILRKSQKKNKVFEEVKRYYSKNDFELLWNQLEQRFNCQETSSAGRVLDAVSLLLGFCQNERNYKHEPTILLEKNSSVPFSDLRPKITQGNVLDTTYLLSYLRSYLRRRDKKRLAATAQRYIAQGLYGIISDYHSQLDRKSTPPNAFASGGISSNRLISGYLKSQNVYLNEKIPAGDAGISFGQIIYFLLADPRD